MDAAAASGLTQAKISRLERGLYTPNPEDVKALARAYKAPAAARRELERTAKDLAENRVYSRVVLQRGAWKLQKQTGRIEAASERVRTFQPMLIPGLLQTRAYAAAVIGSAPMTPTELERAINTRMERQELLGSGRRFDLIMTEAVLRWPLIEPAGMIEQIEHIAAAIDIPNVHVGVVPLMAPHSPIVQDGFNLYDTRAVIVGTTTATAYIVDAPDVAAYDVLFGELEKLAVYGDDARALLGEIADDYRALI